MSRFRLIFGLCLLLVTFNSCRPRGVLSKSEMVDVLYDIHLAEAMTKQNGGPMTGEWTRGLSVNYFNDLAFQAVLRKHKITQEEFYNSVRYYSKHLGDYSKIYDKVGERLKKFSTDVTNWKYMLPSIKEVLKTLIIDTLKSRELYFSLQYSPDTISGRRISNPHMGSITYFGERNNCKWLREYKARKESFSLIVKMPEAPKKDTAVVIPMINPVDTISGNQTINHIDASGQIKKEVVAIEARKIQPNSFHEPDINKVRLDQERKRNIELLERAKNAGKH